VLFVRGRKETSEKVDYYYGSKPKTETLAESGNAYQKGSLVHKKYGCTVYEVCRVAKEINYAISRKH
jgi:hypothetical protein